MDSSTTLNGDVQAITCKDAESCKEAPEDQITVAGGPTKEFIFIPVPRYLRHSLGEDIHFGLGTVCLLSFCTIFLVANLAYMQPLLIQISKTFNVSSQTVSQIPTIIEAGYATGIIFISPLGDTIRRRQLSLLLILASASITIGLALTSSFLIFRILAFFLGMSTISPQIIITLARDHAHPSRKATFYSIILSGYLSGMLAGRLISGAIAHILPWHFVLYFAFAAQYAILGLLYLFLPDIPAKTKHLTYPAILRTMAIHATTQYVVVQSELLSMALGAAVGSYSVTLTFLLSGAPYHYSTLQIGLFGLTDLAGIVLSPVAGYLVDHISPWGALLGAATGLAFFQAIDVAAGGTVLSALIVRCVGVDAVRQLEYIALSAYVYSISVESASRLNALLVLAYYLGQLVGSSVGTIIFVDKGPQAAAAFGLSCYVAQIVIVFARRPQNANTVRR